jgi:acyl carrier protein
MVQAAVVQVFQRNGLEELAAFVVANDCNEPFDRDDLLTVLRKRLPPHMVPGYLDLLDEIPTLPSGKADRKRLPEPKTPLVLTERKIVPPKTELEAKIVSIWEHLFKLSPISTEDDFFLDLGGYSLLAAQMVSLLRNECKLNASIRDIYTYSTISKLAQQLTACGDHSAEANSDQQSETERSSKAVLESMPSITRWCVIGLQAITICLLYGVMSTPLLVALLSILSVTSGRVRAGNMDCCCDDFFGVSNAYTNEYRP